MIETLAWSTFEPHLHSGNPCLLAMGGARDVLLGFNPQQSRLYVRLPADPGTVVPPTRLSQIEIAAVHAGNGTSIEVSTGSQTSFREFHQLAGLLTEIFEDPRISAAEAIATALDRWSDLLATRTTLSVEQQLGIIGELLLLEKLIGRDGASGLAAWTGRQAPAPGRHDFRLANADVEVKSTLRTSRVHSIHGLEQLSTGHGRSLYVLSLRFDPSGMAEAIALPDMVATIRAVLHGDPASLAVFEKRLQTCGYSQADEGLYVQRFRLADAPKLIPINDQVPCITSRLLAAGLSQEALGRLAGLAYEVNFDGLGSPEGESGYHQVLPEIRLTPQ